MKRKSFMRSLIISYLIIAVLPLTLVMGIYAANTIRQAENTARQRLESATELISSQFDSILNHMSFLSINLVSNETFMNAVEGLNREESVRISQEHYAVISSELCSYAITSSVHDVTFFNDAGYLVTSHDYNKGYHYGYRMEQREIQGISWYQDVQDNFGQEIVIPVQENQIPKSDRKSLTLVRAIRNPGKIVGYLCVEIAQEDLSYLLEMDEAMETELLITNADGTVLYGSEGFPARLQGGKLDTDSLAALENTYFVASRSLNPGTVVYMVMSRDTVYGEMRNTVTMLGLQTFGLLCLTILVISIFSKDLSKPLRALREEMRRTTLSNLQDQGNEKLFDRYEEVSYVYHQFHEMRERLDVLIQKEMENQKMYLEERMNYLQAQINPHFMCNTLNVIGIMGIEHGVQEVHDACLQLSSLLQYSIADKADRNSTLGDEMANIQDYLELMQLRYEHKLEYTVFYEEEMDRIPMPRLVLEPFVENIFVHAYSPRHKIVRVNVTGYIQKNRWYVVIEDDGQGMEAEQLRRLKEHINDRCRQLLLGKRTSQKYGIGIENTLMRLYLCYNDGFRYELESQEDAGLRITLSAELEKEENDGTDESDHSRG